MLRQLREPPVTGITTTPAGAHIGTQVFAVVGTDEHTAPHLTRRPDMRIDVVKAALKLTPDQEKSWPAVEDAIRARAKNRQARFADIEKRVGELREGNPIEVLRNRDTVDFLQRRADALAQRSADLKKLAGAWEPLYKTLSPDQKQRMAFLTLYVLHEVRNAAEERTEEEED